MQHNSTKVFRSRGISKGTALPQSIENKLCSSALICGEHARKWSHVVLNRRNLLWSLAVQPALPCFAIRYDRLSARKIGLDDRFGVTVAAAGWLGWTYRFQSLHVRRRLLRTFCCGVCIRWRLFGRQQSILVCFGFDYTSFCVLLKNLRTCTSCW